MNFKHDNIFTLIDLFQFCVRPILDYVSVVCSSHHIYEIDFIEDVQRNFTKQLPGLCYMNYNDRLSFCHLEPLELCRLHNDLTILYKILRRHVITNYQ